MGSRLFNTAIVGFIYTITNTINGKLYIGITKCSIQKRFREHKHNAIRYKKINNHLYSAIRKYGIQNFEIKVLKTCYSDKQLYRGEIYFIKKFDTTNRLKGYNNSTGGEISSKGFKHSIATKQKLALLNKNRTSNQGSFQVGHKRTVMTEERKLKISLANRGRLVSEETKKLLREKRKLQVIKHSDTTKRKIGESNRGIKRSDEFKKHISILRMGNKNNLGRIWSEEEKKKMSLIKTGTIVSQQTRDKMSETHKKIWEKRKSNVC